MECRKYISASIHPISTLKLPSILPPRPSRMPSILASMRSRRRYHAVEPVGDLLVSAFEAGDARFPGLGGHPES